METDNCITITHFINPHLFWYKTIETPGEKFHVLTVFEQSLLELYKNKPSCDNLLRPQVDDKVAVNYIPWNKYIRAKILQKAEFQQEEYIVWALDYGFPLLTKKEYIRNLPKHLQTDIGYVQVGGIANIYPAEQEYDDIEGNLVMVKKDKWLQKTCNMLEKLLADANSISFIKHYQTENGHAWGDLIVVNHKGIQINAREYLLSTKNADEEDDLPFKHICSKFKSTKIAPWLSNDRNTKMKYNNIKHNYIEHSKKMNATIIDENVKRKVEDWQERNERKKIETATNIPEISCELSEDIIDDVTFDDSVSVAQSQQINYIGKAGALTKIKQKKYSTGRDLPPCALPESFDISKMMVDLNMPMEPQHICSSHSNSSNASAHMEKLSQLSVKEETSGNLFSGNQNSALIDFESNSTLSNASSLKLRKQNLFEMRKKIARAAKEIKNNSVESKSLSNQNESNNTTNHSKTSDSYPYNLLEQSLSLSTLNNTIDNVQLQDNKNELSVTNIRVKQLIAMRKKFGSSSFSSSNDNNLKISTTRSQFLENNDFQTEKEQQKDMDKKGVKSPNNLNFQLESKGPSTPDGKMEQKPQTYSVTSVSKTNIKENLKISQAGFDSLTMLPAGFDITRLQTYNNEEDHWHRKKSTCNVYVPHDQSLSADELFSNNVNHESVSSSDLNSTKTSNNRIAKSAAINSNIVQDSQFEAHSQDVEVKKLGGNYLSTPPISSQLGLKLSRRKKLKSPTSQLLKIDQILLEHCTEKELGNKNILDLQLLNTSSSSHKSLLSNTPTNNSCSNRIESSMRQNSNIRNCSSHTSSSTDNIRNDKNVKEVFNNEILMDIKPAEYLPIVEGERKIQTKFIDHLVLAHSSIPLTPIENISDAPFLPEIHEELHYMRVNKVYRIQVYSWSHVLRNNSLFVVNPSRSGKTWSYLPSLCSLLCCRKDEFKPSYGPVAVILVASLKHVELVNNYCRRLMNGFKAEAPTCIPSYGIRNLIETKIHLLNGCGILVATPSNILRLLHENENEPLFDAERLQHIVIDDMDIMMSRSQQDFENAYTTLFKMAKKSKFKKLSPQLIVTSRDWDGVMVKFIRKSNQPLLLIGDFLEAAVYGQATISVKLKSNCKKNDTILKFMKKEYESAQGMDNRTLIICNEDEDVHDIYKFLQECGYPCLCFYSRSTEIELVTVDEWKKQISSQILICTDARLCELNIQNVNNLIHYSLPTSWTQFTLRFSALARTYNNFISHFEHTILSTASTVKKNCAHSMILLDENNNMQLPRLVNFLRKHNQKVQDEILAVSKRVLTTLEEQRISNYSLLCPQLLEFGECDEPRCNHRHELTRFDVINKTDGIPCHGEIRMHVLKVFSPTYYVVRLLYHKPSNTTKWLETRRSSEALAFGVQLNIHYRNDSNLFLHWPPHVNDLCIYQYADNFRRARILEAPTFQQKETNVVQSNLRVTLRLIDDGNVISSVKCSEIFVCDEKFKDFPHQAIEIRLMKVVPFDNERSWDSKTTKQVQKWIMEDIEPNYVVQASIDFSLVNTIWVKNVVVMEKLTGIDAYCQVVNLKKSLVEKNFGLLYSGCRKHVRDLAEEFNLLNPVQFDVESGDSDLDFESCKNESINLIKFSSSNDEDAANCSMLSAETELEQVKTKESRADDPENTTNKTKLANVEIEKPTGDDDWDDNLLSGQQFDEVYDPFQICDLNKNKSPKEEAWSKLPLNELVKVEIGDEGENGNWENIFLQVIDNNSMLLFDELNNLIATHVEKLKSSKEKQKEMYDFEPLHNCIVRYDNLYLRAKIYGVYGENLHQRLYKFFLCDYACFTNARTEELYNDFLYETTEEIINFTPYQAVHCTLAGIKWDRFTKRHQVTKDYLYACAVLQCNLKQLCNSNLQNLPIQSYKILLYECEKENEFNKALLLNKALVDNGITVYDEETKNFLDYEIRMQENVDQKCTNAANQEKIDEVIVPKTDKDQVLTYEQLIDFIKSDAFDIKVDDILKNVEKPEVKTLNINAIESKSNISESETSAPTVTDKKVLKEKPKMPTSDSEMEEQGHCTSFSNSSTKSSTSLISTHSESGSPLPPPPSLKALHKRPLTTWYQNDWMIFLLIYAPDVKDYLLEVSSKTVLFVAEIQSEKSALVLNLLGSVDSRSVSHEVRGVNVVIRLMKKVFLKWPRLLQQSTKFSWLKYNFNAFDSIEMEYVMPQQVLHSLLDTELTFERQQTDNNNSDEDDERELYQTYNRIENNDDECDPFSL